MKLSLSINTGVDSEGDSSVLPEKAAEVLEGELAEIYPASENYDFAEISLSFVTPDEIRKLNFDYRNIDEATDVLSFPLIDFAEENNIEKIPVLALGDIVICREEVSRLHPELDEREGICLMIAHSFLHLLGFDHDTDEKQDLMWRRQDEIKSKILAAIASKEKN